MPVSVNDVNVDTFEPDNQIEIEGQANGNNKLYQLFKAREYIYKKKLRRLKRQRYNRKLTKRTEPIEELVSEENPPLQTTPS